MNGKTYIASEIKALFALGVRASWDREIMCGIHYGFVQRAGRTIFDGIYAIPPGHMLTITKGKSKITRYWDFDYPPADSEANVPTFSEAVQLLREKLVKSVRLRLRSDVPVEVCPVAALIRCDTRTSVETIQTAASRIYACIQPRRIHGRKHSSRDGRACRGANFAAYKK